MRFNNILSTLLLTLLLALLAACQSAVTTAPQAKNTAIPTGMTMQAIPTGIPATQQHVECNTASVPHVTLDAQRPVVELQRGFHCMTNMADVSLDSSYVLVFYSLGAPQDVVQGGSRGIMAPGLAASIAGTYALMPSIDGKANIVILAAVKSDDLKSSKWPIATTMEFVRIIASHNEDICGWLKDNAEGLVKLMSDEGITIAANLASQFKCGNIIGPFGQPLPTIQP